jgi:acylphosphatase
VSARRAVVSGRVQGVGFRWFAERTARELGLQGWVRNLPDGSVETLVEGPDDALARYFDRLRRGPAGSRVEALVEEDRPPQGLSTFDITR